MGQGNIMQAIIFNEYGSSDVLQLKNIEKPTPKNHEVLVKIQSASINPLDWRLMRATPFLARLENGLFKPKNPLLGADLAGRVEAIGSAVTAFKVGDEVFGEKFKTGLGALAEYACVAEDSLVLKPANITFEEASSVPIASLTALQGLRKGNIQAGKKVLINGASGGVGMFAVQIAKSFGAEVTAVCSTTNIGWVHALGADHIIDYTQTDFTRNNQHYDLIYCAVGNRPIEDYKRALAPQGQCVIVGLTSLKQLFSYILFAPFHSKKNGKQIGIMGTVNPNKADLLLIQNLLKSGKIRPVIDRIYPLNQTAQAMQYLEKGHAKGKVIIKVSSN
jgi:NADPH:quinone reductase-like Zn-dependent oxidoreductase